MTKIATFLRFNRDDYRTAQSWFLDMLDNLNVIVDALNITLHNGTDIDNNMMAERQTVTLSHGVPVMVRLQQITSQPSLVRVGFANGFVGVGAVTAYNPDGTVMVTVYFQGTPPATAVATTLVFE